MKGPTAAPKLPVPSIIAVTVAKALLELFKLLWVPNAADTAVVIRAYGPFTSNPTTARNMELIIKQLSKIGLPFSWLRGHVVVSPFS